MPISLFGRDKRQPTEVLEEGWQLYAKPTTLEPVGTLFRIDASARRFMVDHFTLETQEGSEAVATVKQRVHVHVGIFARFFGLDSYGGQLSGQNTETFEFEIADPIRQMASDAAMDRAIGPVLGGLKYRADNRYYVIRETRSATSMTYRLTQAQLGKIGGEESLAVAVRAGAKFEAGQGGIYEINQAFPERMRVMFLAEEIVNVKPALAGGQPMLGRVPVRSPLVWSEG
jgi:hypothetical protein